MKIIVDTNKYSGNFEREMCAFATAQVGECGVGVEEVDEDHSYASWWETHIQQVEDGCWRPVAISPTPGFINDGMGGTRFICLNELSYADIDLQTLEVDFPEFQAKRGKP